ncbi:MAG TPA: L,D-transpeptidase [Thermomicrobiales bacterium]|jgi:hypothetical protein
MVRHGVVARIALVCAIIGVFGTLILGAKPIAATPTGRDLPDWAQGPSEVYFEETGHHLGDPFLYYWRENGGRAIFGLPISEVITSANGALQTQYFERMTLQFRPNSGGATALLVGRDAATNTSVNLRTGPGVNWNKVNVLRAEQASRVVGGPLPDANGEPWYEISGPFGTGWTKGEFLERKDSPISIATLAVDLDGSRAGEPAFRRLSPVAVGAFGPDTDDATYFPSTGHTLTGDFLHFWAANGGISLFGLPLSEPFTEVSAVDGKPYRTQYFEHARLEYHPEGEATGDPIQIGTLGRDKAAVARINTAPVAQRANVPVYNPDLFTGIRWIEVNISEQRLTAYEGDLPIVTTLIRSGKEGWNTPTGTFRTFRKVVSDDMTLGDPSDPDYYYTPNVPWVMYFLDGGFALHGAVWDDMWGTPTSHGCVNIPVDIAAYLYDWAPLGILVWIHH